MLSQMTFHRHKSDQEFLGIWKNLILVSFEDTYALSNHYEDIKTIKVKYLLHSWADNCRSFSPTRTQGTEC